MTDTAKIKVQFLDQAREGMARELEINENQRIDDFLYSQLGDDAELSGIKIRLNGDIVTRTTTIPADSRIIISPLNIKGA